MMQVIIGFLTLILLAVIVGYFIMRINQTEQNNQMMQLYMDSIQDVYSTIQVRVEAARKLRHDLASHIQTLEYMMEQQKDVCTELKDYANSLVSKYQELKGGQYCQDEIINTFLMIKKQQCDEKNIALDIEIEENGTVWMEPVDRIGLLHNLLDNAIEANERIPKNEKRGIEMKMKEWDEGLYLCVTNCLASDEQVNFKSKKTDGGEHGIGMQIIDALVKKYHGTKDINWNREENLLTEIIQLKYIKG